MTNQNLICGSLNEVYGKPHIDLSKVTAISFDGIDYKDYPDFCDAYIVSCEIDGRQASEEEIEELNSDSDFVYEKLMEYLY